MNVKGSKVTKGLKGLCAMMIDKIMFIRVDVLMLDSEVNGM